MVFYFTVTEKLIRSHQYTMPNCGLWISDEGFQIRHIYVEALIRVKYPESKNAIKKLFSIILTSVQKITPIFATAKKNWVNGRSVQSTSIELDCRLYLNSIYPHGA
jgi:hypothetical protein